MNWKKVALPLAFVLVFAASRIPGMLSLSFANFSAAYALAFCAGVFFPKRMAWWFPLTTLILTDLGLNLFYWLRYGYEFWQLPQLAEMSFNYLSYAALIWLGKRHQPTSSLTSLLGGGILGSLLFYLLTNTASWLFNPFHNPEYTKTLLGWITALTKGTGGWPETWHFFRNTLLSGGLFTALFAGALKLTTSQESPQDKVAGASTEPESTGEPEPAEIKA